MQPGMLTLTWTSMNISGYLHSIHSALFNLNDLVDKIRDLVENRIDRNLQAVCRLMLVDLPTDESFTLEKFVQTQEGHIKGQMGFFPAPPELPLLATVAACTAELRDASNAPLAFPHTQPERWSSQHMESVCT